MSKKVVIIIVDSPENARSFVKDMRRVLNGSSAAFVFDNCAVGSREAPRRLEVDFCREVNKAK